MASNCRHCDAPIIWIAKPSGGWFRPFDAPEELLHLDYEVTWDKALQDWAASPVDTEMTAKLREHDCPRRAEILAARRQRDQEEQEEREPLDRLEFDRGLPPASELLMMQARDPGPRYGSPRERVIFRNPAPEKYVKVARRLKGSCPTCGAKPFEWCTYKNGERQGEETTDLHTARKAL